MSDRRVDFGHRVDIDLGDGHTLRWMVWKPDPELNPGLADLPGSPDDPVGAIIGHTRPDGVYCEGTIHFDTPRTARLHSNFNRWTVESWEPLTLSPSLVCAGPVFDVDANIVGRCGDHGFIREGRWVRA